MGFPDFPWIDEELAGTAAIEYVGELLDDARALGESPRTHAIVFLLEELKQIAGDEALRAAIVVTLNHLTGAKSPLD